MCGKAKAGLSSWKVAGRENWKKIWTNEDFRLPIIALLPSFSFVMEGSVLEIEGPERKCQ